MCHWMKLKIVFRISIYWYFSFIFTVTKIYFLIFQSMKKVGCETTNQVGMAFTLHVSSFTVKKKFVLFL